MIGSKSVLERVQSSVFEKRRRVRFWTEVYIIVPGTRP